MASGTSFHMSHWEPRSGVLAGVSSGITNKGNIAIANVAIIVASVLLPLTWLAVSLRVWVRGHMIRSFGWDDWIMLLTLAIFTVHVSVITAVAVILKSPSAGSLAGITQAVNLIVVSFGAYCLETIALKISLTIFFLRIVIKPWQRNMIWAAFATYSIYGIAYFFVVIFQCGNPAHFLQNTVTGNCMAYSILDPLNYLQGGLNAATDWVFAILPIFVLWGAQLPRRAKITAGGCLVLGTLGSVASVVRLFYVRDFKPSNDFFQVSGKAGIWSVVEPGLGITAASLATLRPLFKGCLERARTGVRSRSNRTNTAYANDVFSQQSAVIQKPSYHSSAERAGFIPIHDDVGIRTTTTTTVVGNFDGPEPKSKTGFNERISYRRTDSDDTHFGLDGVELDQIRPSKHSERAAARLQKDLYGSYKSEHAQDPENGPSWLVMDD